MGIEALDRVVNGDTSMISYMVLSKREMWCFPVDSTHLIHSDNEGNMLKEFTCKSKDPTITEHWFKETIVKDTLFQREKGQRSRQQTHFLKGL